MVGDGERALRLYVDERESLRARVRVQEPDPRATCQIYRTFAVARERDLARKDKDFARADALRNELLWLGAEIKDGKSG